ncbi:MAG: YncE family protein [Dokdonella sp.]
MTFRLLPGALALFACLTTAAAAPATAYTIGARWTLGGSSRWDYLNVDAAARRLFVTRADHVDVINIDNGTLQGTVQPTEGVHGVAVAANLHKGYASNGRGDSVSVFDLTTLATLKTIPIAGHNPDTIVFDAPSAQVFTFNGKSHDATVIDTRSDAPVATIALAGVPEFAVSDGSGRIYLNIEDRAELDVIDTRHAKLVATWPLPGCEEPSGLALDAKNHRLFSVCANGHLVVTNAVSGRQVAAVPIGQGPDAVAFDAERHLVFSANGVDGTLSVIHQDDADHYVVAATVPTQKSARTLALDPVSHRVFLAAAEFEPAPAAVAGQPKPRPALKPGSFAILVAEPLPKD